MTKNQKAIQLIKRIRQLVADNHTVTFMDDMGDGLTVYIDNEHFHTYNGKTRSDEDMIQYLYDNLKWPMYEE
jgi:hypothetical protein